jgi:hypothetical protein
MAGTSVAYRGNISCWVPNGQARCNLQSKQLNDGRILDDVLIAACISRRGDDSLPLVTTWNLHTVARSGHRRQ